MSERYPPGPDYCPGCKGPMLKVEGLPDRQECIACQHKREMYVPRFDDEEQWKEREAQDAEALMPGFD